MKKIMFTILTAAIVLTCFQASCTTKAYADNKDIPINILSVGNC